MAPQSLADFTQQQLLDTWDKLTAQQRDALCRRAQTDLYFLAKVVLGYKDLVEHVHRAMCDLFIRKDLSKAVYEQDEIKERLLLSPRGCFKTTIDIADIIQWIVAFPDITILILSGTQDLAAKMVHEVRAQFIANPLMRKMFPECCLDEGEKSQRETYLNPARKRIQREPTLETSTVSSIKAGSHYDVIKGDDVVHENNSSTIEQLVKAKEAIDATRFLLNPGGYFDFIGTRYNPADAYGQLIEFARNSEDGPIMKKLIQAAWALRPGNTPTVNADTGFPIYQESDVELLFPERLPFKLLNREYKRNPYQFTCQRLNDPAVNGTQQFDLAVLQKHTIPYTQLPTNGVTYVQWDFAGSNPDPRNDRTVGIAGLVDRLGRLFIVDVKAVRVNANTKAACVVDMAQQWCPAMTYIEDSFGSRDLEPTIIATAQQLRVTLPMTWKPAPRAKNSKENRIAYLNKLLANDRLFFVANLEQLDDLVQEFVAFPHGRHDDIPDAIAQLVKNVLEIGGACVEALPRPNLAEIRERAFYNALFSDEQPLTDVPPEQFQTSGPLGYGLH